MPMNHRLLVPRKTPGLLDLVPGAAAAYSLRSLSNSYAGPVVTVRRSSDNAEEDFTASEVADGTLAAFCGAGDGFVKQWWDQSGNARHAVAAADANEPQIVDSGVVVREEGKPAIDFDGTDDSLSADLSDANQQYSIYFVYTHTASFLANTRILSINGTLGATTGAELGAQFSGNNLYLAQQAVEWGSGSLALQVGKQYLLYFSVGDGSTPLNLYADGVPLPSATSSASPAGSGSLLNIFARGDGANNAAGYAQELVIYPSDLTAQRELIEGNIAWGYSV